MVLNRLCDADSKLNLLRWVQTVSLTGSDLKVVSHRNRQPRTVTLNPLGVFFSHLINQM
jgi:hypothetical protein